METPLIAMQMEAPSRPSGVTQVFVIVKNSRGNTVTFNFVLLNGFLKILNVFDFVSCFYFTSQLIFFLIVKTDQKIK